MDRGTRVKAAQVSESGVRASDRGFLSFKLEEYLKLLDWTGRMSRVGVGTAGLTAKGKIPADLAPILQRLGIEGSMWCDLVWNFKKYFGRGGAAGTPKSLKEHAANYDRKFQRGQSAASECFVGD